MNFVINLIINIDFAFLSKVVAFSEGWKSVKKNPHVNKIVICEQKAHLRRYDMGLIYVYYIF